MRDPTPTPTPRPLRIGCAAGFSGDRTDAAGPVVDALIAARRPGGADLRDAGRAHAGAGAAARGAPIPRRGYEPLLDDAAAPGAGALPRARHPHRQQLRRRQSARRGAAHRARWRASSACARRASRWSRATTCRRRRSARCCASALGAAARRHRASSAPTPTSAPSRSPTRSLAGARSWSCGRVADPSLDGRPGAGALRLARATTGTASARATMAGHLLECGAQVSGGYFADPGFKDVPGLAARRLPDRRDRRRRPLHHRQGRPAPAAVIDAHTVKEQLLYEVHDPAAYLTPDVVADIGEARVDELGARPRAPRAACAAMRGRRRSRSTSATRAAGWPRARSPMPGARAEARARLAAEVLRERLHGARPLRVDLIGVGQRLRRRRRRAGWPRTPRRRRARRAPARRARHADRAEAERLAREVTALYTCGPAGGGGVRTALRRALGTLSCLRAARGGAGALRDASTEEPPHEHARHRAALPRRPRPHRRQGQPLQHQRDRLAPGALAAAGRAGHRGAWRAQFAHRAAERACSATCCRSCRR